MRHRYLSICLFSEIRNMKHVEILDQMLPNSVRIVLIRISIIVMLFIKWPGARDCAQLYLVHRTSACYL